MPGMLQSNVCQGNVTIRMCKRRTNQGPQAWKLF